jgi:hypothetical protein
VPSFLNHNEINQARWDAAVANDPTCLPYGFSWWLNAVCPGQWNGVVFDDYRAVMPLPKAPFSFRRPWSSWARPQVQRPFFTQQVGPWGKVHEGDVADLFAALPASFTSFELPFTEHTLAEEIPEPYTPEFRTNYVLDLSPELEAIRSGYHKGLRRKLRKHGPVSLQPAPPELILELYRKQIAKKAGLKTKHFTCARALIKAALQHKAGHCYQVKGADNETLATGFFPHHKGRIINLLPVSTPAGYRREGMAQLIDEVIKKHSGPGNLLDFEGSDVPGIAKFFGNFGPQKRPYLTVR